MRQNEVKREAVTRRASVENVSGGLGSHLFRLPERVFPELVRLSHSLLLAERQLGLEVMDLRCVVGCA